MTLQELHSQVELLPEVAEVREKVLEVTGKDLDLRPWGRTDVTASTKIARQRMSEHIIYYRRDLRSTLSHAIAHECGHILRMFAAAEDDRLVPASDGATMRVAREAVASALQSMPVGLQAEILPMWVTGLVTQLTSLPADIHIETWLHSSYEGLRGPQREALATQGKQNLSALATKVLQMTPWVLFRAANAMNLAFATAMEPMSGTSYRRKYSGYPEIRKLGEQLLSLVGADVGYRGDIETAQRWAACLGVSSWFKWVSFEDMPESYYAIA